MNASTAIQTAGLRKSYGSTRALRGVDLEVKAGEIFGFLGPNGAGKTTTIRCLLDLIRPNGGTIRVLGLDPRKDPVAVRARTGYLPGESCTSTKTCRSRAPCGSSTACAEEKPGKRISGIFANTST